MWSWKRRVSRMWWFSWGLSRGRVVNSEGCPVRLGAAWVVSRARATAKASADVAEGAE